jgi:hypothetical protein
MGQRWEALRLRRAAVRYARHGWPVVPGAYLETGRFRCGPGCCTFACHPYRQHWEESASIDPLVVAGLWDQGPHAVLLATGWAFDVLDISASLGAGATSVALSGPVVATPTGRWMVLVEPGSTLRPELAALPDVVLHGPGSWIPAPPTRTAEGRVRFLVGPEEVHWRLPDPWVVQAGLVATLAAPGSSRLRRPSRLSAVG